MDDNDDLYYLCLIVVVFFRVFITLEEETLLD
jgi:hypothetical protein